MAQAMTAPLNNPAMQAKLRRTGLMALSIALGAFGLGFASVPLYRYFCQVTGFGGTTQRGETVPGVRPVAGKTMSVRFDSNVAPGMPWQFKPEHTTQTVEIGARAFTTFIAKNMSDKPVTGSAVFNVTPTQSGAYFTKIQCFCFTEQTLQPGQEVRMPVIYYVDPKIMDDPDNKDTQQITLSYTFNPVEPSAKRS